MDVLMEEFQHLKIQLEELQSGTDNFSENKLIGRGGFGNVYKGVIPRKGQNVVAIKRLNPIFGQGNTEFWREITMLSRFTHENLISLVGFCDEGGEKILVYEYAYHGSLDSHLSSPLLSWIQRIKICLEAARGLSYLHDDHGTHQRVLHRDIKSSNILLDENWKAKVSDMGLAKIGPSNQLQTAIVTDVVGTYGYLDPLYMETGILSKESDVYSFGVVLFEVLCGISCYEKYNNGQYKILVRGWKESYKQNNLGDIIFQDLAQLIDPDCLETFSKIAFQCLQKSRDKRPTMSDVVETLENALDIQENAAAGPEKERLEYYREIIRTAEKSYEEFARPAKQYLSKRELSLLLSKGVLLNNGKTRFWLDNNGKHCEMVFIQEEPYDVKMDYDLEQHSKRLRTHVRAQFLSPLIKYTVNLVYRFHGYTKGYPLSRSIKYRLVGETEYLIPYIAGVRGDGNMMVELYQFTSDGRTFDLQIEFEVIYPFISQMPLVGIEFRPLEKAEHEVFEHEKVDLSSDLDTHWKKILPDDYQEILKSSEFPIQWTTKKELYVELCKGFLMNNGQEWFFLNKNGKKCHMVSANNACEPIERILHNKSRFREAAGVTSCSFSIVSEINSQLLSPETTYGTYLVYELPKNHSVSAVPVEVYRRPSKGPIVEYPNIYLVTPQVPVIRPKADENTHNPLNSLKGLPTERSDGWMEVQVWEFQTGTTTNMVHINLQLMPKAKYYPLVVLGIEIRPI